MPFESGYVEVDGERRRMWRLCRNVPLTAERQDGQRLSLTTVDLGPGGVRAQAAVMLHAGDEMRLSCHGAEAPEWRARGGMPARVVWCHPRNVGPRYEAGLAFTATPHVTPSAIESWLKSCGVNLNDPREQRVSPRLRTVHVKGFLYVDGDHVHAVNVVDLARGGTLVACPDRLPMGTPVRVGISLGESGRFESLGRVVRVKRAEAEGLWMLAVEFTATDARERARLSLYLTSHFKAARKM